MHKFNYSFLKNGLLPAELVNVTSSIASLKTMSEYRKTDYRQVFTELEKIAKVQSVKSSNAIEGIVTTDERIHQIVNQNSSPLNHNEAEIAGYRDVLSSVHQHYAEIDFTEQNILILHRDLFALADYGSAGRYKIEDNLILETNADGINQVRFRPVSAADTKAAMEQLILAYTAANNDVNINKLLLIPCVILDFLCIHPFRDGNGRMSRLLSLLLLYRSGYDVGRYVSFEERINEYKSWYYKALHDSSAEWHNSQNDYFPFIQHFLSTLYQCYTELDKRFAVVNSRKVTKAQRIEATVLNSLLPISKADVCHILPDISPTTVEAVLGQMVKNGIVTTVGAGRATKYVKVNEHNI